MYTPGDLPVKIPDPPRSIVEAFPFKSKLKPILGSNKYAGSGISAVLNFSPFAKVIAVTVGFSNAVSAYQTLVALNPTVNLNLSLNLISS
ncbi:hypothetical protein D3C86_1946660 [compost metagenome]